MKKKRLKTKSTKSLSVRLLSGFMSALMIFSVCPVTAFADDTLSENTAEAETNDETETYDESNSFVVTVDSSNTDDVSNDQSDDSEDTSNVSDLDANVSDNTTVDDTDKSDDTNIDDLTETSVDEETEVEEEVESVIIEEDDTQYEYRVTLPSNKTISAGDSVKIEADIIATATKDDETTDVDYEFEFVSDDITIDDNNKTSIKLTFDNEGEYTIVGKLIVDGEEVASDEITIKVNPVVVFDHYFTTINTDLVKTSDLIVKTDDSSIFTKNTNVVSNFDDVYIIECEDVTEARYVYSYYVDKVDSISDMSNVISIATDENEDDVADLDDLNDGSDVIAQLNDAIEDTEDTDYSDYIALIDTGADADVNFSVIDDDTSDKDGHGTRMLELIKNENPDAKVMSIKVFNGSKTDAASVYAGIKLAIENNVKVINLSLVGADVEKNAIVKDVIQEAIDNGIVVIGAAGNYNLSATKFIPGSINDVIVIGAVDEDGIKLSTSNYNADYYVIADSTSEATAIYTGLYSINALDDYRIYDGDFNNVHIEDNEKLTDAEVLALFDIYDDPSNYVIIYDDNGSVNIYTKTEYEQYLEFSTAARRYGPNSYSRTLNTKRVTISPDDMNDVMHLGKFNSSTGQYVGVGTGTCTVTQEQSASGRITSMSSTNGHDPLGTIIFPNYLSDIGIECEGHFSNELNASGHAALPAGTYNYVYKWRCVPTEIGDTSPGNYTFIVEYKQSPVFSNGNANILSSFFWVYDSHDTIGTTSVNDPEVDGSYSIPNKRQWVNQTFDVKLYPYNYTYGGGSGDFIGCVIQLSISGDQHRNALRVTKNIDNIRAADSFTVLADKVSSNIESAIKTKMLQDGSEIGYNSNHVVFNITDAQAEDIVNCAMQNHIDNAQNLNDPVIIRRVNNPITTSGEIGIGTNYQVYTTAEVMARTTDVTDTPEFEDETIKFSFYKRDTYFNNLYSTPEGDASYEGISYALVLTSAESKHESEPTGAATGAIYRAKTVTVNEDKVGTVMWVGTTDSNGFVETTDLEIGTYTLYELPRGASVTEGDSWSDVSGIYANDSMQWSDHSWPFRFYESSYNLNATTGEVTSTYEATLNGETNLEDQIFTDDTVLGNIHIQKKDIELDSSSTPYPQGNECLAGIQFAIVNVSNYDVHYPYSDSGDDYSNGEIVDIVTTDSDGEASCDGLPYGTYEIHELRKDNTWSVGDNWDDDDGEGGGNHGTSRYVNDWYCWNEYIDNVEITNASNYEVESYDNTHIDEIEIREQDHTYDATYKDLPIRSDFILTKTDENGYLMPYIPFRVSLVEVETDDDGNIIYQTNADGSTKVDANGNLMPVIKTNTDGTYKILESHVIVTDLLSSTNPFAIDTRNWSLRPKTASTVNQLDGMVDGVKFTGGLADLYAGARQNIWFGPFNSYDEGYFVNKRGSLLAGTYVIEELTRQEFTETDDEIKAIFGNSCKIFRENADGDVIEAGKTGYDASGKLTDIYVLTNVHGYNENQLYTRIQLDTSAPTYDLRSRIITVTKDNSVYGVAAHDSVNSTVLNHPVTIVSDAQDTITETNSTTLSTTNLLNDTATFDNLYYDSKYLYITHAYRVYVDENGERQLVELDETKYDPTADPTTAPTAVILNLKDATKRTDNSGRQYTSIIQPDGTELELEDNMTLSYDYVDPDDHSQGYKFTVIDTEPATAPPFDRVSNLSIQTFYNVDTKSQCDYGETVAFAIDLYQWSDTVGWVAINHHNLDANEESQNVNILKVDTLANNKTTDTRIASLGGYKYNETDANLPLVNNAEVTGELVYNDNGEIVGYTIVDDKITYSNFAHNHYYNFKAFLVDSDGTVVKDIYGNNCETDLLYLYIDKNLTSVINGMNITPETEDGSLKQLSIEGPCDGEFNFSTFGLTDWVIPNFPNGKDSVHVRVVFYDTRGQVDINHNVDLSDENEAVRFLNISTKAMSEEGAQGILPSNKWWDENGIVHYDDSILRDEIKYWNLAEETEVRVEGFVYLVGYDENGNRFIDTNNGLDTSYVAHESKVFTLDKTHETYAEGGTIEMSYLIKEAGRYEDRDLVICERVYMDVDGYCTQVPVEVTMRRLNETHGDSLHPTYTESTETYLQYVMDKDDVNDSEVLIALHEDINDELQTVHIPKIETHLVNKHDGTGYKIVDREYADVTVYDTVSYSNLKVGEVWTFTAELMDQATGNPVLNKDGIPVVKTIEYTPDATNSTIINGTAYGTVEIPITFEQQLSKIDWENDPSWVCFESLRHGEIGTSDVKYAVHNNINDEQQTVNLPTFRTTISSNAEQRDRFILAEPNQTVTDTVAIKNVGLDTVLDEDGNITGFVPGTFTLRIQALDAETGEPILDANGQPYVATKLLTIDGRLEANGTVTPLVNGEVVPGAVTFEKKSDKPATNALTGYGANYKDFYIVKFGSETSPLLVTIDLTVDGSKLKGRTILFAETLYFGDSTDEDDMVLRESKDEDTDTEKRHEADDLHEQWAVVPDIHTNAFDPNLYDPTTYNWDPTTDISTGDGKHLQIVVNGTDEWYVNGQRTSNYELKIVDELSLINIKPDTNYTIVTKLIDKETGEFVKNVDGTEFVVRTPYISPKSTTDAGRATAPAISQKSCECYRSDCTGVIAVDDRLLYNADPSRNRALVIDLAGTRARYGGTFTVYEYLEINSRPGEVFAYDDVNDGSNNDVNQTFYVPQIKTTFVEGTTHTHLIPYQSSIEVTDSVAYRNLTPDSTYKMYCILMKSNGQPLLDENGNTYEDVVTFTTPAAAPGEVTVDGTISDFRFTISAEVLSQFEATGTKIVAFEQCVMTDDDDTTEDVLVAIHTNLDDEDQTIYMPHIGTTAWDVKDHDKWVSLKDVTSVTIVDTVNYTNLCPGKSYTLTGKLMYQDGSGQVTDADGHYITASRVFVPETSSGSTDVTFTFPVAGADHLTDQVVVVFEDLYYNNIKLATHSDLEDTNQTINLKEKPPEKPPTPPSTPPTPPTPPEIPYNLVLHVSILKADYDNHAYMLKNAEITIYEDKACTKVATDIHGNACVGLTDADGYVDFYIGTTSPDAVFYAKETKAPFGYKICNDVITVKPTAERDANNMCPITLKIFDKIIIIPPKTGDNLPILPIAILTLLGVLCLGAFIVTRKKVSTNTEDTENENTEEITSDVLDEDTIDSSTDENQNDE